MSWRIYLLLAVALLISMAFKLTKILVVIIFLSIALIILMAYFSKKRGSRDKA